MHDDARLFLRNLCWYIGGSEGASVEDGFRFGQGLGFTRNRLLVIVHALTEEGYFTLSEGCRFTLTARGAAWYRDILASRWRKARSDGRATSWVENQPRRLPREWTLAKKPYQRAFVRHRQRDTHYRRIVRPVLWLPRCPPARFLTGRWECADDRLAGWLNLVTDRWCREYPVAGNMARLVAHIVEEYRAIMAVLDTEAASRASR